MRFTLAIPIFCLALSSCATTNTPTLPGYMGDNYTIVDGGLDVVNAADFAVINGDIRLIPAKEAE